MKPKERVLNSINSMYFDRAAFDFWGTKEYVEYMITKLKLKDHEELLTYLDVDIRYVYGQGAVYENGKSLFDPCVKYIGPELKSYPNGTFEDLWGAIRKYIKTPFGDVYREVIKPPLLQAENIMDIEKYPGWPKADWFDFTSISKYCKENAEYAIVFGGMPGMATIFIQCWYMRGLDNILTDLLLNQSLAEALIEKITDFQIDYHKRVFETASEWIDFLQIGDDYGTEKSLMISPDLFRKYFKSKLRKIIELAKKYNKKVILHSDGNIRSLIPDFIDIGVDILNPIQWGGIQEMNPQEIKKEFGKYLSFHGGIDAQQFLPKATPSDIKSYVSNLIKTLGDGGGYIVSPTHTIELDVPLENTLTLYKECIRK